MTRRLMWMLSAGVSMSGLLGAGGAALASQEPVNPVPFWYDRVENLVDAEATPAAQALYAWLAAQRGKRILTGQCEATENAAWAAATTPEQEFLYLRKIAGKTPSVRAFDFIWHAPAMYGDGKVPPQRLVERAIRWWKDGGIVAAQWHWNIRKPDGTGAAFYTYQLPGFDFAKLMTEGTAEHQALLAEIDVVAGELKLLQDAGVPVLWRPLHENSGGWFWWGTDAARCKQLWALLRERLIGHHRLHNLIWVWNPAKPGDFDAWYPGDDQVDLVGQDVYPNDGAVSFADDYRAYHRQVAGRKLIALTENGAIPDPARMQRDGAHWAFFCTWNGFLWGDTADRVAPRDWVARVYQHPYALNRDELPAFASLPLPAVGLASRIAVVRQPGSVPVGGRQVRPITVQAYDASGTVVRSATAIVTLRDPLGGSLTAALVNGVATFAPGPIDQPLSEVRYQVSAPGLGEAASDAFAVGPGRGIGWARWKLPKAPRDLAEPQAVMGSATAADLTGFTDRGFASPTGLGDDYVLRLDGVVIPPVTGDYVFHLAGDDRVELWLQRDPAGALERIGRTTSWTPANEFDRMAEQHTAAIHLEAGRRYPVGAILEQDKGGDGLAIGWTLPDGTRQLPIPASRIDPR